MIGFAIVIILGLGGLAVAGIGLGGYLQTGFLSSLGQVNSIIMMAAGGGGGIAFLIIGIVGSVKNRQKTTHVQDILSDPSTPGSQFATESASSERTQQTIDNPLVNKCMELYKTNEDAWVMVPPQTELRAGKQPVIAIGSASYHGVGQFKIHISVDPAQMVQAIHLVLRILHQEGAPNVGLKFQTEHMLASEHQIGKEFALLFSADAEQNEETTHAIGTLLSQIERAFADQEISPEKGLVLTANTRDQIAK